MARNPLARYEKLQALAQEITGQNLAEVEAVKVIREWLRKPPHDRPPELGSFMDTEGIQEGYIARHLLTIHQFYPDVRDALAAGLPLAVSSAVNGVVDTEARAEVLAPFWAEKSPNPKPKHLLPRGLSTRIRQLAQAARKATTAPSKLSTDNGWVLATGTNTPERASGNAWIYPVLSGEARTREALPARPIEALLAEYLPAGGRLVDVTAGSGTIAKISAQFGISSWSCDIVPGASFVHQADAKRLFETSTNPGKGIADLLVVHPPSYIAWLETKPHEDRALATLDEYAFFVGDILAGAQPALALGGKLVMITRPVRNEQTVSLVTSHISQLLAESNLQPISYHIAVSEDGQDDWHMLVGVASANLQASS